MPRMLLALGLALLSLSACAHGPAPPRELADVTIIDRDSGARLPVYWHRGQRWIAGEPGHRYAIRIHNRSGGRLLAVTSVDGVNVITGETAAWSQGGYVFGPGQGYDITGWRKSNARVAAFEFAALAESYAARTGRPDHVGAIGVALFREARADLHPPAIDAPAAPTGSESGRSESSPRFQQERDRAGSGKAAADRLGTGHGRSETSHVHDTTFDRASSIPDQTIVIRYDRRENLVALGVIRAPADPVPQPFPGSLGFVPDPPR